MVYVAQVKNPAVLQKKIVKAVRSLYGQVCSNPAAGFHFPVGVKALRAVGYPNAILRKLPTIAKESFAGVGYHFASGVVRLGDRVLDIGSGSGTDLLVAATLVGPKGRVTGVDITDAMVVKAKTAVREMGLRKVTVKKTSGQALPFPAKTFDVVISNGVINLIPDKRKIFREIFRVLKPGGWLSLADIALGNPISERSRQNPRLWAECIVGASLEPEYLRLIRRAGLRRVRVIQRLDYFANSPTESTRAVAKQYEAHAVVVVGQKPEEK